jgi:diguanylate cyclase (GGDEF)-like protein
LKTIGDRLLGVLRATDTVARWGGDEFVIILESIADLDQVIVRIQDAGSFHLEHQGKRIQVTPSIGIACYPGDGQDSETLLKRADNAMYLAKENGGNQHRFYSEELENT